MDGIEPSDIRKWTAIIESAGGINLAQGNSFIEPAGEFEALVSELDRAVRKGANQTGYNTYSNAAGVPALRLAIAEKCRGFNGFEVDPDPLHGTVTVTCGATGGLLCALHALADPGDEVVLFAPFYGYHLKTLQMLGIVPRVVSLTGEQWSFRDQDVLSQIGPRTKAIIVNTPNNPTGKVFSSDELLRLGRICLDRGIRLITDEVYEFITYDGRRHVSAASLPEISSCVVTISSFSKTLAITGWRLGYVVADGALTERIRIANEMLYVCAPTPLQHAIAPFVADWSLFLRLGETFGRKRDLLCSSLDSVGISYSRPSGAYYVLAKFGGFASDVEINQHLVDRYKVAGVPGSAFYLDRPSTGQVRFCFAVLDAELQRFNSLLRSSSI